MTKLQPTATATVPLPSADLITYRFDQTDKKFEELFVRLDSLSKNFVTKEEFEAVKRSVDVLNEDRQRGIGKSISRKELWTSVGTVAVLMGGVWWIPDLIKAFAGH